MAQQPQVPKSPLNYSTDASSTNLYLGADPQSPSIIKEKGVWASIRFKETTEWQTRQHLWQWEINTFARGEVKVLIAGTYTQKTIREVKKKLTERWNELARNNLL
jgi:hypothetical protein